MADEMVVHWDDIVAAAGRIAPYAVRTPLVACPALSARLGATVFLKLETLQRTGSFKFRGATNRLAMIAPADRRAGVVAFSSGNHAQGVAAAAALFGMPALIVMPSDAPRAKIAGTRALKAEVLLYDRQAQDREAIALQCSRERGATLVRPYDDAGVIAGQGTVGLEIAEDAARLGFVPDAVLAPCSGGGLVTGVALGLQGARIKSAVHSVEPDGFDGMKQSLASGGRMRAAADRSSVADALQAPIPGEIVFSLAKSILAPGLTVDDTALLRAVSFAATQIKLLVEPSGAAAIAALLSGKLDIRGKAVVAVVSGGNADFSTIAQAVERFPEA